MLATATRQRSPPSHTHSPRTCCRASLSSVANLQGERGRAERRPRRPSGPPACERRACSPSGLHCRTGRVVCSSTHRAGRLHGAPDPPPPPPVPHPCRRRRRPGGPAPCLWAPQPHLAAHLCRQAAALQYQWRGAEAHAGKPHAHPTARGAAAPAASRIAVCQRLLLWPAPPACPRGPLQPHPAVAGAPAAPTGLRLQQAVDARAPRPHPPTHPTHPPVHPGAARRLAWTSWPAWWA